MTCAAPGNPTHCCVQIEWPQGVSRQYLLAEAFSATVAVDLMYGRDPTVIPRMEYDAKRGLLLPQAGGSHVAASLCESGLARRARPQAVRR